MELLAAIFGAFHRPKLLAHPKQKLQFNIMRCLHSWILAWASSGNKKIFPYGFDPVESGPTHTGVNMERVVGSCMNVSTSSEAGYC